MLPGGRTRLPRVKPAAASWPASHSQVCSGPRVLLPYEAVWVIAQRDGTPSSHLSRAGRKTKPKTKALGSSSDSAFWLLDSAQVTEHLWVSVFSYKMGWQCLLHGAIGIIKRGNVWESTEHQARNPGSPKRVFKRGGGGVHMSSGGLSVSTSSPHSHPIALQIFSGPFKNSNRGVPIMA